MVKIGDVALHTAGQKRLRHDPDSFRLGKDGISAAGRVRDPRGYGSECRSGNLHTDILWLVHVFILTRSTMQH